MGIHELTKDDLPQSGLGKGEETCPLFYTDDCSRTDSCNKTGCRCPLKSAAHY